MLKRISAILISASAVASHATPSISIGDMHEFVESDARTLLKRVANTGTSTAFVRIELKEIVYENGEPVERDMAPISVTESAPRPNLVASPARLIIPADSAQSTRLLALGPREIERYYRVRFLPVMPRKDGDFALTDDQQKKYADSLSAGLTLLMGYGAIVIVRPSASIYKTVMIDETNKYIVRNAGNTTITVQSLLDCNASGVDCEPVEAPHRLLPNREWVHPKKPGRHYRANLVEGKDTQAIKF